MLRSIAIVLVCAAGCFGAELPTPTNLIESGTFTRSSIAFLNGKQYVANAPRKQIMATCSVSDLTLHTYDTVEGVGNIALGAFCKAGTMLYATGNGAVGAGLYKSTDGKTWTQVVSPANLTGVLRLFGSSTGYLFVAKSYKLYRSTDVTGGGLTNTAITSATPVITFSENASPETWNWYQALNGTICCGEYSTNGPAANIYRSTNDGATFTTEYTEASIESGSGDKLKHQHAIIKHEATGRWLDVWGDGPTKNKVTYSDNDGDTWANLEDGDLYNFQPVCLYDYGDADNVLYGSDDSGFLGTYNVTTKQVTVLYEDGSRYKPFVFSLFEYKGVYYGCTYDAEATSDDPMLIVSNDLIHWAPYYKFRNSEWGILKFVGVFGGKIHAIYQNSSGTLGHCSFSPVIVQNVTGLCIDPETTNLLNTTMASSAENATIVTGDGTGWATGAGTLTSVTTDALHGTRCAQLTHTAGTIMYPPYYLSGGLTTLESGSTYNIRTSLKGGTINLFGNSNYYLSHSTASSTPVSWQLNTTKWTDIQFPPLLCSDSADYLFIYTRPLASVSGMAANSYALLVDCLQVEKGPPTRWQIGGTPRTAESLTSTITLPSTWTEVIIFAPESRAEFYTTTNYIKTLYKDATNYLRLSYQSQAITLDGVTGGSAFSTSIAESTFYKNQPMVIVVRYNGAITISLAASGGFTHISTSGASWMSSSSVTSKLGNESGALIMSGTLCRDDFYNRYLSDNEVVQSVTTGAYQLSGSISPLSRGRRF